MGQDENLCRRLRLPLAAFPMRYRGVGSAMAPGRGMECWAWHMPSTSARGQPDNAIDTSSASEATGVSPFGGHLLGSGEERDKHSFLEAPSCYWSY